MANRLSRIKSLEVKLDVDNEGIMYALKDACRREYGREATPDEIKWLKERLRFDNDRGIFTLPDLIADFRERRKAAQQGNTIEA